MVFLYLPKDSLRTTRDKRYNVRDNISAIIIRWCQVLIVSATIINSVRINEVKLIATMWINSPSNIISAPYIITPPENFSIFYKLTFF